VHELAAKRTGTLPRARWVHSLVTFAILAFAFLVSAEEADARLAGRTRLATAESAIGSSRLAAIDARADDSPCAAQPAYPVGSLGGLFSRPGLIGGFAAGFLGAGVFGLLFGHGMIGELSSFPSMLGLLLQVALLFMLGRLIWTWWRADKAAAMAKLSPRQLADAYERMRNEPLPDVGAEANAKADSENSFADEAHLPL
jgi:predicted lipid-binding transport protein (Tim44 family)